MLTMKQIISGTLVAMFALTTPTFASPFGFGFKTAALSSTEFEVSPSSRGDIDGYWCAASDFARRTLGAGWRQRIYVVRGYGPGEATGRRTAVQFSLNPPAGVAPPTSGISIGFKPGQSRTVQSAYGQCNRYLLRDG